MRLGASQQSVVMPDVTAVVMAKLPEPGRVKTRLVASGALDDAGAAALAWALLECTTERLAARMPIVIALGADATGALADRTIRARLPRLSARIVPQGDGSLGARLDRVWRLLAGVGPLAFFGTDSPDLPAEAVGAIRPALARADAAIGPSTDGGYWALAALEHQPALLRGVDWGTAAVYDQTLRRADEAGITVVELPAWPDVDRPEDLLALRRRLAGPGGAASEAPLARLAARLDEILETARIDLA
jgi:hypothetical protein